MRSLTNQLELVQRLKEILHATGDKSDYRDEYKHLRGQILSDSYLKTVSRGLFKIARTLESSGHLSRDSQRIEKGENLLAKNFCR